MSLASASSIDGALERVSCLVPRDVAETHQLPSPDGCLERFLGTHEALDRAPHLVIGLVLSVRDAEKLPQALRLECLNFSLIVRHFSHP